MELSPQDIAMIVAALQDSDWDQAMVTVGDTRIALARNGVQLPPETAGPAPVPAAPSPAVAAAPAPPAVATPVAPSGAGPVPAAAPAPGEIDIVAPSVGVFWSSPSPGAPPFVTLGGHVSEGEIVCIVEVMKLMTNVAAKKSGTVVAVFVENGENIEFGTPLFRVRQDS